jgi:hypothetical protein
VCWFISYIICAARDELLGAWESARDLESAVAIEPQAQVEEAPQ